MAIRLLLMDRAVLERDGVPVPLEPRFMAVLIRLSRDLGRNVRVEDLGGDVLLPDTGRVTGKDERRRQRVHLYKCVSAIRAALDPERRGDASTALLTDAGPNSGYRLVLPESSVDVVEFERLVADAANAPPVRAAVMLRRALALWRDRPLIDVEHYAWGRAWTAHLHGVRDQARRRLLDIYEAFDSAAAADVAASLADDHPHDRALRERLVRLGARRSVGGTVVEQYAESAGTVVRVCVGDLFDQHEAHLVAGFTEAFETNTANDFLVSRASIQGQLLHRLFDGDRRTLDTALRQALRGAPRSTESRVTKRYGKLSRYPLGTTAVLNHGGRRIFAVAYTRVGPDGIGGRSSPELLRGALDGLWDAVRRHGQRRPVAMGILGSGLARIDCLDRVDLLDLTLRSYLEYAQRHRLAEELRIVVRPGDVSQSDLARIDTAVCRAVADHDATEPATDAARS